MIKTQYLTPEIYYKESRDFQFFGRMYDVIFNYVKTNVDLMENFPINQYTDSKLIELLARTLGFKNETDHRNDDLNAICNVFIKLMKQKGSLNAIKTLTKTILNVENISKSCEVTTEDRDGDRKVVSIQIQLPDMISNPEIKLMEEVLDYIMPIGVCYNIKATDVISLNDIGEIQVTEYARAGQLKNDKKAYTNVAIANNNEMITTNNVETKETIEHEKDIVNPSRGDIRYSRVPKKSEGD